MIPMTFVSLAAAELYGNAPPVLATEHSAAVDLRSALLDRLVLEPGIRMIIPAGLKVAFPVGYAGLVCPRSGLAGNQGVTVLNAPGVIDPDYRGELGVILFNAGHQPFEVRPGDRIAQLMIVQTVAPRFTIVEALDSTPRGDGGFGHTGT